MKSISFDTGINEYDLGGKVTVRFNPTDVGFLEKLSDSFAALDLIQEEVKLSQEEITDEKDVFNLAKNLDGKMRDILGATYGTMKKPTVKQTFDPCDLDSDDAAQVRIWNLAVKDQDYNALAAQDMLLVHFYAGTAATPFAERYASCMIEATGLGGKGGGNLGMPLTITFGGTRTTGTASKDASTGEVTFTPGT